MFDFYVKTVIRFSLRYKRLFEIIEVEITRVDCILFSDFQEMNIVIDALVNDTTGTLMAGALEDNNCAIGLVLCTQPL